MRSSNRGIEEKTAQLFLSVYRGLAYVIAISVIFSVGYFQHFLLHDWILVGMVGAYTLFKLFRPFHRYKKNAFTYTEFAVDLAICSSLPLLTGGLLSPFLLYCLSPILTSALFFPRKLTFSIFAIPSLSLVVSQLPIFGISPAASFRPPELWFSLLGVFFISSLLLGWLPYVMNINASRGIRTQAIIEERSRLSREMHDGVGQALGILHWKTELLQQRIAGGNTSRALAEVVEIRGLVEEAQQETREIIDELRTNKQGFVPALAQYATEFTQTYGIRCELHVADGQVNLPLSAELELLRIAREALTNVRRHSRASMVEVAFESKQDAIEMTIRDNGCGFDTQATLGGHGLVVMEERARSLGGELAIITSPEGGTEVKVRLAVAQQQPASGSLIKQVLTGF